METNQELLEIRREILELHQSIIKIAPTSAMVQDHETRLRYLETFMNKFKGAVLLAALGSGIISGLITLLFQLIINP